MLDKKNIRKLASQHKFIDHTADIAVEITADSFEELIKESLTAYNSSVLVQTSDQTGEIKDLKLSDSNREELLVSFLNEINFLLTVEKWITKNILDISVKKEDESYLLICRIQGFNLTDAIELKEEIKSVTYHQMEIKEEKGKLFTRIVFDI